MAWDKANGIYKPQINQANLVSDESSHSNSIKKKKWIITFIYGYNQRSISRFTNMLPWFGCHIAHDTHKRLFY